tara:strand:+ start:337 stop:528 length:192 start_codon:yes stop_codon:yes gene_type:complete
MFNSLNDIWEAAYDKNIVGMKVSAELASEFECYDGNLTIEDNEGVWIEIDEQNVIIETGCLGM